MTGGFEVAPGELVEHSRSLAAIADGVADCREASDEEGVGGLVYGVLFDPTALPILSGVKSHLADLITNAAEVGHGIAGALSANATTYSDYDHTIHQDFRTLLTTIPNSNHPAPRSR